MLSCQELTELVTDYLEGNLSAGQRFSFWLHVMLCGPCREYLRQVKLTRRTLGQLKAEAIPTEVEQEMLQVFRNWRQ